MEFAAPAAFNAGLPAVFDSAAFFTGVTGEEELVVTVFVTTVSFTIVVVVVFVEVWVLPDDAAGFLVAPPGAAFLTAPPAAGFLAALADEGDFLAGEAFPGIILCGRI